MKKAIVFILFLFFASCASPNYYSTTTHNPHQKKMSKSEKRCAGSYYANRVKRTYSRYK